MSTNNPTPDGVTPKLRLAPRFSMPSNGVVIHAGKADCCVYKLVFALSTEWFVQLDGITAPIFEWEVPAWGTFVTEVSSRAFAQGAARRFLAMFPDAEVFHG